MSVTESDILTRVAYWQGVLAPLGISHWTIEHVRVVDFPGGRTSSKAGVWTSEDYDDCKMEFKREVVENLGAVQELDETIVHEWLHVAFRDFDEAVLSISDSLAPLASDIWENRVDHEAEGLIDRLAKLIVDLHDY